MNMKKHLTILFLLLSGFSAEVLAATCTSVRSGDWDQSSTWSCTGGTNWPGSGDSVIISNGDTVQLDSDRSATDLTIEAGATLDDDGRELTLSGSALIDGIYDGSGNDGRLIMTGNGQTLSGTGTIVDIDRIQIEGDTTIPSDANLALTQRSEIRLDSNNVSLTIDGIIDGTSQSSNNRILNLDNTNSSVTVNGTINAPNSYIDFDGNNAAVTNNGVVIIDYLQNDHSTQRWTQGSNSSLILTQATSWSGHFSADATGNTVTYNGTATPLTPDNNTYYNLAGTYFNAPGSCPHGFIVLGTSPCATAISTSPGTCVNDTSVGSYAWSGLGNVGASDNQRAEADGYDSSTTNYLKCTGYNFAIPANAVIEGIVLEVEGYSRRTFDDAYVHLVKADAIQTSTNYAAGNSLRNNNDLTLTYGGLNDLWGGTWTAADINSATFGAAFAAQRGPYNTTDTVFIDHMPISVYYTIPPNPTVLSINRADADPTYATSVSWTVTFSSAVTGVNAADFTLIQGGVVSGAAITQVSGSGTSWTVTASTGTGTGTLGLNLVDNDTIIDGASVPLGGTGTGNGNFTGEVYTITSPPAPVVSAITLNSASPTDLASVSWTVTFNMPVLGVDLSDFLLVTGAGPAGPSLTSVSGSGTSWTVTASTGSGNGTLGLNLVDDDTINNGITPLGGAGTGNGDFTGAVYTISRPIINTYYPATATIAGGATAIPLGAATGNSTPISAGDLVLIMQMQDASIDATNTDAYGDGTAGGAGSGATSIGGSGLYEYAVAASDVPTSGGALTLCSGTLNAYTHADATSARGQRRYQVIRVPVESSFSLYAITAAPWDGTRGGVVALDVTGTLNLNGATVSVDGLGFRGGAARGFRTGSGTYTDYRTPVSNLANGTKGEGIAGTPYYTFDATNSSTNTGSDGYANGSFARGAPGNAGGGGTDRNPSSNNENSGGGGGGNGGNGGIGGIGWCPGYTNTPPYYGCGIAALAITGINPNGSSGGFGGSSVSGLGATRLTLGGGGGSGTTNDSTGSLGALSTSGAPGGGIILIRATSMSDTATFSANGANGDTSVWNDGSGGGGAGGAVLISAGSGMDRVTIYVNGGTGGSNLVGNTSTTPHGPGGGGGGGLALTSGAPAACNASGGSNGLTYYGSGSTPYAYGAMPGGAGSCATSLTGSQLPGTALGSGGLSGACPAIIDHYAIEHGSGVGVTCTPNTLTIKACADTSCSSLYTGGASGTLSATGTPTVNWVGGAGFSIPSGAGSVTKDVQITTPGTVVFGTQGGSLSPVPGGSSPTCNFGTPACTFTSLDSGLLFDVPDHSAETVQTITVSAVKKADNSLACVPAFANRSNVPINFQCSYSNPIFGSYPVRMGVGNTNTPLAATALSACSAGGANLNLDFDANGVAQNVQVVYADAGLMSLAASYTGSGASETDLVMTGLDTFVSKPASFALTIPGNPAATGAGGGAFKKAGEGFEVTVEALNASGDTTPNYGKETTAESVMLTRSLVAPLDCDGDATNDPDCHNPALNGSFGDFATDCSGNAAAAGSACGTFSWAEVGILTLTPGVADGDYLGAGDVTVTAADYVGRFVADHFDVSLSTADFAESSGTFTYMDQPFFYNSAPTLTITAKGVGGETLSNYEGDFWKLGGSITSAGGSNFQYSSAAPANGSALSAPGAAIGFGDITDVGGSLTLNGIHTAEAFTYQRPATAIVPFDTDVTLAVTVTDSDGATGSASRALIGFADDGDAASGNPLNTTADSTLRFGRLVLENTFGPETQDLSVPLRVQYTDENGNFITNTDDLSSSYNSVNATLSSFTGALNAGNTVLNATAGDVTVIGGLPNDLDPLQLLAPGADNTGTVDVTLDLSAQPWLRYDWTNSPAAGPNDDDPTATVTFGSYRGNDRIIFWQEIFN